MQIDFVICQCKGIKPNPRLPEPCHWEPFPKKINKNQQVIH